MLKRYYTECTAIQYQGNNLDDVLEFLGDNVSQIIVRGYKSIFIGFRRGDEPTWGFDVFPGQYIVVTDNDMIHVVDEEEFKKYYKLVKTEKKKSKKND